MLLVNSIMGVTYIPFYPFWKELIEAEAYLELSEA